MGYYCFIYVQRYLYNANSITVCNPRHYCSTGNIAFQPLACHLDTNTNMESGTVVSGLWKSFENPFGEITTSFFEEF